MRGRSSGARGRSRGAGGPGSTRLRRKSHSQTSAVEGEGIAAAEFKAKCLSLFNKVRETGVEYVVTKHGTPVAKVVPYHSTSASKGLFGSMSGTVLHYDRPFDPIDGEYDINRD